MALNFAQGFVMSNEEPIDNRLVMTKAEMLAMKKAKMPSVYFTICSDDGKMYIYNSSNDIDSETGRFRILQSTTTIDTDNISQLVSTDSDNILEATSNGLKVSEYNSISSDNINNLFTSEN